MSEAPVAPAPTAPAPEAPAAPVTAPPAAPAAPAAGKVEELPEWAQKLITETRAEAAKNRTEKTEAQKQRDAMLAAAGLAPTETDPVKLAEQLASKDAQIRDLTISQASAAALAEHGGKPLTLAAMRGEGLLASLDPTSATFQADVSAAVKTYIEQHPELKAQAAGASGVGHPGGSGEGAPITEQQLASMTPEQIEDARSKGLLAHLL